MFLRYHLPTCPSNPVVPVSHVAMWWYGEGSPSTSTIACAALGICVSLIARYGSDWLLTFMRYDAGMSSASCGSVRSGVDAVVPTPRTMPESSLGQRNSCLFPFRYFISTKSQPHIG